MLAIPSSNPYKDVKALSTVVIGGIQVTRINRRDCARLVVEICAEYKSSPEMAPLVIFAANGNTIALAATSSHFAQTMEIADIVHADGQSIVFASKLLTAKPLAERCATTDFFHDMAEVAATNDLNFFLFGGPAGLANRCAKQMTTIYPDLRVSGTLSGYFADTDVDRIIDHINRSNVDVLWVGLGVPNEQYFVAKHRHKLKVAVIVTCGGCFNYVTGDYPRAPKWMQNMGLEWFHRLLTNPRYLFFRYLKTNPLAVWKILSKTPRSQ